MTELSKMIQETQRRGGIPHHLDVFLDYITEEHEEWLRGVLADTDVNHEHATRVVNKLMQQYPEFKLSIKVGSLRRWRVDHAG